MRRVYDIVAGIDVHKKWLYVVIATEGGTEERLRVGSTSRELQKLAKQLKAAGVECVVMESTANYWRPVWAALEGEFPLYLAQAQSNAAPHGRKTDYGDAIRLIRRFRAGELRLSYVPEAEQRGWRLLTRTRVQYRRDITRLRNRMEGLLEECRIKLSGVLSDLLGSSGRRILRALIEGETDTQKLAALGDASLKATPAELADALNGQLGDTHRLLLEQSLERIEALEADVEDLDKCLGEAQQAQQEVIRRLCAIPGVGVIAAREIVAELGPTAASFPTAAHAASWIGVCPGRQQSAGRSYSDACAKGSRNMRRILNQCAWAAVRTQGSWFQEWFRKKVPRLGIQKSIWAVAHRLERVIWIILHEGVEYQERSTSGNQAEYLKRRLKSTLRAMRKHGIDVQAALAEGS